MAIDMGLYRCLPYLVRTGMGSDKTPEQLQEEHALVVGARIWLTVRTALTCERQIMPDDLSCSRWSTRWPSTLVVQRVSTMPKRCVTLDGCWIIHCPSEATVGSSRIARSFLIEVSAQHTHNMPFDADTSISRRPSAILNRAEQ